MSIGTDLYCIATKSDTLDCNLNNLTTFYVQMNAHGDPV